MGSPQNSLSASVLATAGVSSAGVLFSFALPD